MYDEMPEYGEKQEQPVAERFLEIPWDALETDILHALVEEFVSREGTDYGSVELSLTEKVEQVISGVKNKRYVILFDQEMQSCHIADKNNWDDSVKRGL